MDLHLEIAPPLAAVVLRELTKAEVAASVGVPKGSTPIPIAKLRDTHHALARCLAGGMKDVEASAVTGYTQTRISILKSDTTFSALVAHYREHLDEVYFDLHKRMADLSGGILAELQERFEAAPEGLSNGFLHDLFKTVSAPAVAKKRSSLGEDAGAIPVTMDLSRLDTDERAQVRQILERRLIGTG